MEYKKLGELFKISSGGTPSKKNNEFYNNGNIPWIKTGDLKTKYIDKASEYITELAVENSSAKLFPKNTVLIAMYGATIGATSILKIDATTNQACCAFLPNNHIVPEYLYYFLKLNKEKIVQMGVGGAQPNISATILKEIELPFIDLENQIKIVNILDKAQELIDKRKEQIEALDELVKSKFIEMFGDAGLNSMGWEIKTMNEVSLKKGEYGSGSPSIEYIEGKPRYIRITDINDNGYLNENKVTVENLDEFEKYKLNDGDILFARTGATVGKSFRYKSVYGECLFAGYLIRFVPNTTIVNPDFLYSLTKTNYYENWVKSKQKIVAQPNINARQYGEELKIIVPPIELQNQFADFVKEVYKLKLEMEKSLKELEGNFNSLMQRAFKGELF